MQANGVHFYQPVQGVVDLVDTGQCGQMRVQLEICEGDIKINICYFWQLCTNIWAVHGFLCVCSQSVFSLDVEVIENMEKRSIRFSQPLE